jgi:3-methyladenine DNA glycosylase AlkD
MTDERIASLRARLEAAGTRERAVQEKAYLKSDLVHLGVGAPAMKPIVRAFTKGLAALTLRDKLALARAAWDSGVFELRVAGMEIVERYKDELAPRDLAFVEALLREAKTWALVDAMAVSIVGHLHEKHGLGRELDRWSKDPDFWIRRSAMLALLRPLRRGDGEFDRFSRYADAMLEEKEFFIRKAIGWILRETSKKRPALVSEWLGPRAHRASGVTMREAVKHVPERDRERLMKRYREKKSA